MTPFGEEHAEIYDEQFAGMAAIRDSLHLLARTSLAHLPADARLLVVGAGTGSEVLALAAQFPLWTFHLVDPAPAMLKVARRRLAAASILDRCRFHDGYIETLEDAGPFHGATSFLVSQFITDAGARRDYFREIAARLLPGGTLVTADLAADRDDPAFDPLMLIWQTALHGTDFPKERVQTYKEAFGRDFAVHGPAQVERMMADAGFAPPVQALQALLIRAWVTQKR